MVAPSFQKYENVGEPYELSGKMYINVKHPNTGNIRKVRYYSEFEYIKAYGALPEDVDAPKKWYGTQKDCLGFKNGYITIFKEAPSIDEEIFNKSQASYTRWWGWSFSSEVEVPEEILSRYTPIKLFWEQVGGEDGYIYDDIEERIDEIIYIQGRSQYLGAVGEKIEVLATIVSIDNEENERYHSTSSIYSFEDESGNKLIWKTSTSQTAEEGDKLKLKGTIKELKKDCGDKVIVLTRCKLGE